MARTQVGGIRTVAQREAAEGGGEPDLPPPSILKEYKHVFQTAKASLVLSLKRRVIHWKPDGTREEEIPTSEAGNRLDMIRATDFFYKTNDDEIAAAIEKLPLYGVGNLIWRYEDQVQIQREARAAEIRAALAADPELQKHVALTPSDKKDWDVGPKSAVTRQAKAVEEMTPEELEAATAPPPGSRTR